MCAICNAYGQSDHFDPMEVEMKKATRHAFLLTHFHASLMTLSLYKLCCLQAFVKHVVCFCNSFFEPLKGMLFWFILLLKSL